LTLEHLDTEMHLPVGLCQLFIDASRTFYGNPDVCWGYLFQRKFSD